MAGKRVRLELWINLDPVPGTILHTIEDARHTLQGILRDEVGAYDPIVAINPHLKGNR